MLQLHLATIVTSCYSCAGEGRGEVLTNLPPAASPGTGTLSVKTRRPWLNKMICGGWGGKGFREPSQRVWHCREDLHWAALAFLFFSCPPGSQSHCSILSIFFLFPGSPHSLGRSAQLLSQQINIFLLQKAELDFLFTLMFLSCHI